MQCWNPSLLKLVQLRLLITLGLILAFAPALFGQATAKAKATKSLKDQPSAKIRGMQAYYDSLFRDSTRGFIDLIGHVQVLNQGQLLIADRVRIWDKFKKIDLAGNVSISTASYTILADQAELDYETNLGWFENAQVRSGAIEFSGTRIVKSDTDTYDVSDAEFTSCSNCPPSWSFTGSSIDATIGKYAFIKNSFMKIGDVPVFWLPYLVLPLKNDRQTGLLPPEFLYSNDSGKTFALPFYWVISPSQDATLTAINYEHRGLKGRLNYRYLVNSTSHGEFSGAILSDRKVRELDRFKSFHPEVNSATQRWFVKYEHYLDLPGGYVQRAEINNASDLLYPRDFTSETFNDGAPAMENRISLSKNTYDEHYSLEANYFNHMLQGDPLAGSDVAVHKFPEFRYETTPRDFLGGHYTLNFNYANFTRAGPAHDDLTPPGSIPYYFPEYKCKDDNGVDITASLPPESLDTDRRCHIVRGPYNPETDMIRTGQRFDFAPTWYYPMRLGPYIDALPRLTYRETQYLFGVGADRTNARRYFRTDIQFRSMLSATYDDFPMLSGGKVKHEIVPAIAYTGTPWLEHKSHPFFGFESQSQAPFFSRDNIKDLDLTGKNNLQFDYNDRIYDRNLITLALTNRLIQKQYQSGVVKYKQVASLILAQSYDASQASLYRWSDLSAVLDIKTDLFENYSTFNYYPEQNVTNTSNRIRLYRTGGDFFELLWNKQYPIKSGESVAIDNFTEDYGINIGVSTKYVNAVGQIVMDRYSGREITNRMKSWGVTSQIKPPGECWVIGFTTVQPIDRDPTYKVEFEFIFDGVPKPSPGATELESLYNLGI